MKFSNLMLKKLYSQNDIKDPNYYGGNKGKYSLGLNLTTYGMFCCHFSQKTGYCKTNCYIICYVFL